MTSKPSEIAMSEWGAVRHSRSFLACLPASWPQSTFSGLRLCPNHQSRDCEETPDLSIQAKIIDCSWGLVPPYNLWNAFRTKWHARNAKICPSYHLNTSKNGKWLHSWSNHIYEIGLSQYAQTSFTVFIHPCRVWEPSHHAFNAHWFESTTVPVEARLLAPNN